MLHCGEPFAAPRQICQDQDLKFQTFHIEPSPFHSIYDDQIDEKKFCQLQYLFSYSDIDAHKYEVGEEVVSWTTC